MCLDNIEYTMFLCNVVPAWQTQHCIGYFAKKSFLLTMGNITEIISLHNVGPQRSEQHCRLFSCAKMLWVNIAQGIFLCNVGTGRSRQHCIGYFPAKTCLCALSQHCTSNFSVQCSLRRIWTTLTK